MRKPFIAGNWKMNQTVVSARELITQMLPGLVDLNSIDRVICPPFMDLVPAAALLKDTDVKLGAQNMFWEDAGAYTGEVSPLMVKEFCDYVIIGHSERRSYFGETNATVNKKMKAALSHGILPILCIGETLEEKEANKTAEVIITQIHGGLYEISRDSLEKVVIAYEPVWAIGTGRAASGEEANAVVNVIIRPTLAELYGEIAAQEMRVLYGGSVSSKNAGEFFGQADIDGALIGGASLKAEEFVNIAKSAAK
jgi:triosephosphate isomerase (TIM)